MATSSGGTWLLLACVSLWLWASCGGQSIRYEDDDEPVGGGSGVGADTGGGVAGTRPEGGVSGTGVSTGGAGNLPNGGVGAAPNGGSAGTGFGMGFGMGFGGVAFGGVNGAGFAGIGTVGFGGFGGRGRGMGGRFGAGGFGAGGRGVAGRFGGRGLGGFGESGGFGGSGGLGANPLDGFVFFTPCGGGVVTGPSCELASPCENQIMSLPGIHPTDVTVTMPGVPGVVYDMGIHFQGLVDTKAYTGGVDQDGYGSLFDGMYFSGVPVADQGTVYLLRVASPAQDYFLNSLLRGSATSTQPFVVDYRTRIRVEGGTTVRLVSADADCSALRNCGTPTQASACNPVTVPNLAPAIAEHVSQPYPAQFIGLDVEDVVVLP